MNGACFALIVVFSKNSVHPEIIKPKLVVNFLIYEFRLVYFRDTDLVSKSRLWRQTKADAGRQSGRSE